MKSAGNRWPEKAAKRTLHPVVMWGWDYTQVRLKTTQGRVRRLPERIAGHHLVHLLRRVHVLPPSKMRPLGLEGLLEVLETHVHGLSHPYQLRQPIPSEIQIVQISHLASHAPTHSPSSRPHSTRASARKLARSPPSPDARPGSESACAS